MKGQSQKSIVESVPRTDILNLAEFQLLSGPITNGKAMPLAGISLLFGIGLYIVAFLEQHLMAGQPPKAKKGKRITSVNGLLNNIVHKLLFHH